MCEACGGPAASCTSWINFFLHASVQTLLALLHDVPASFSASETLIGHSLSLVDVAVFRSVILLSIAAFPRFFGLNVATFVELRFEA